MRDGYGTLASSSKLPSRDAELCCGSWRSDLALDEYKKLLHSIDPSAVPPAIPTSSLITVKPSASAAHDAVPEVASPEIISNLLAGQRTVQRLCDDFAATLSDKYRTIASVTAQASDLTASHGILRDQLDSERAQRIELQLHRDQSVRNEASDGRAVEHYMESIRSSQSGLRDHVQRVYARAVAGRDTLQAETSGLRTRLDSERRCSAVLRDEVGEMSSRVAREAAGRRREIALRLKMLAVEEQRAARTEAWVRKVQRQRDGVSGSFLEADILDSLLLEGLHTVSDDLATSTQPSRWGGLRKSDTSVTKATAEEASIARVLQAEELVKMLVADLQIETDRRAELEKQRVEWLEKEAVGGMRPATGLQHSDSAQVVFDLEPSPVPTPAAIDEEQNPVSGVDTTSPVREEGPAIREVREAFRVMAETYEPHRRSLRDIAASLDAMRSGTDVARDPSSSTSPLSPLLMAQAASRSRPKLFSRHSSSALDPELVAVLDRLAEAVELASVDLEIALVDAVREREGFETLLALGQSDSRAAKLIAVAKGYATQTSSLASSTIVERITVIEEDFAVLKQTIHQAEGMDIDSASGSDMSGRHSIWETMQLKSAAPARLVASPVTSPVLNGTKPTNALARMGKNLGSSVVGAPRKVTMGFASGLGLLTRTDLVSGSAKQDTKVASPTE